TRRTAGPGGSGRRPARATSRGPDAQRSGWGALHARRPAMAPTGLRPAPLRAPPHVRNVRPSCFERRRILIRHIYLRSDSFSTVRLADLCDSTGLADALRL